MVNFTIIGALWEGHLPQVPISSECSERHEDPDKSGPAPIQTACYPHCQNHRSTLIKGSHRFWGGSTVSAPAGGGRISKLFDSRIRGLHG